MAFQLSPGVSVTERDLTTIIPAVSTTNAGFAGYFQWGPANQRITVTDVSNLVSLFGGPTTDNYEYWFSVANFLGYGNNVQVVRTLSATASNAGQYADNPLLDGVLLVENDEVITQPATSETQYGTFYAKYPGSLGNGLTVHICGADVLYDVFSGWQYSTLFAAKPGTSLWAETNYGSISNDEMHIVVIDGAGKFTGVPGTVLETHANLSLDPNAVDANGVNRYFVSYLKEYSKYISSLPMGANGALSSNTNSVNTFTKGSVTILINIPIGDRSVDAGRWGFDPSSTEPGSRYYTGGQSNPNQGDYRGLFYITLSNGSGEYDSRKRNLCPTVDKNKGWGLFEDPSTCDVSLLIGGPIATKVADGGSDQVDTDSINYLVNIANTRKDCIAFITPKVVPTTTNPVDLITEVRNAVGNSSYTVIDTGYKYQYDSYNNVYRYVPLNGDIAGLCARTDLTNDPWYSPAGYNRGTIRNTVKLAFNPNQSQRDVLYQKGVNPVVSIPGEGVVLFGDKTAQTRPSAFDRINVRRLFIVLEKAIATAAKYSLFEFNDAFTRSQFRSMVEPFLRDVQNRRGITDFLVKCDESNNTAQVIDSNNFVADIYIKPARSINFIQLNFIATRTGVSFTEAGA